MWYFHIDNLFHHLHLTKRWPFKTFCDYTDRRLQGEE